MNFLGTEIEMGGHKLSRKQSIWKFNRPSNLSLPCFLNYCIFLINSYTCIRPNRVGLGFFLHLFSL